MELTKQSNGTELSEGWPQARIQQKVERERLIRQLGVWGRDITFRLPGTLPPLPARLATGQDIERRALECRVDLQAARYDLAAVAGQYGLAGTTRFVSAFDLATTSSYDRTKSVAINEAGSIEVTRDVTKRRGLSVDFQIPIYDFGATAIRGAQEAYLGAANRLAELAANARSEAREAYLRYRGNYDLARHYQNRVLPLRQTVQEQAQLQYSGMLVDVTTLIIDARADPEQHPGY